MNDFEVCEIGTKARLAAVEAERDALREILTDIPPIEAELAETSDKLHAMTVERDALLALIADDAFASSFQTMAQYRSALLKSARGPIDAALAKKGGGNG